MDQIISPDIPALCCYLVVFFVGMLVALSSVNQLLKDIPSRWVFKDTWLLFWFNTALPVFLFWFLDYTGAIRDTSLFAALLVAFGYQQIFAGGIKGILMPGQSARLWEPLEAWVNKIAERIAVKNRLAGEKYHDKVRGRVVRDLESFNLLERVAFLHSKDPKRLSEELDTLQKLPFPTGISPDDRAVLERNRLAKQLIGELRLAEPENYGLYLYRNKLITLRDFALYFSKGRTSVFGWGMAVLIALTSLSLIYYFVHFPTWKRAYHEWRLLKSGASDQDRFRSQEFLKASLNSLVKSKGTNTATELQDIYAPILKRLRYGSVPLKQVDELHKFIFHSRVSGADSTIVPGLIETLRSDSVDVRTRAQALLSEIQKSAYTNATGPLWQPGKEDTLHLIEEKSREWGEWWKRAQSTQ